MSIAQEITALNTNLAAAKNAVTAKGGTVGDTGLAGLATEIESIPSGGGGGANPETDPVDNTTQYGKIWYQEGSVTYGYQADNGAFLTGDKQAITAFLARGNMNQMDLDFDNERAITYNEDFETMERTEIRATFTELGIELLSGDMPTGTAYYVYFGDYWELLDSIGVSELALADWTTSLVRTNNTLASGARVGKPLRIDFGTEEIPIPNSFSFYNATSGTVIAIKTNGTLYVSSIGGNCFQAQGSKLTLGTKTTTTLTVGTGLGAGSAIQAITLDFSNVTSLTLTRFETINFSRLTVANNATVRINNLVMNGGCERNVAQYVTEINGGEIRGFTGTTTNFTFPKLTTMSNCFNYLQSETSVSVNGSSGRLIFSALTSIGDNCFMGLRGFKVRFDCPNLTTIGNNFGIGATISGAAQTSQPYYIGTFYFAQTASTLTIGDDCFRRAEVDASGGWIAMAQMLPSSTDVTVGKRFLYNSGWLSLQISDTSTYLNSPEYWIFPPSSIVSAGEFFMANMRYGAPATTLSYLQTPLVLVLGLHRNVSPGGLMNIPCKLTTVGANAFSGSSIQAVRARNMSASLLTFGSYGFSNCEELRSISLNTYGCPIKVGEGFCRNCPNLLQADLQAPDSSQATDNVSFTITAPSATTYWDGQLRTYSSLKLTSSWRTIFPDYTNSAGTVKRITVDP